MSVNIRPPLDTATYREVAVPAFRDISGRRFGRLVAIEKYDRQSGGWRFRCRCDCGTEIITASHSLLRGRTQSCGTCGLHLERVREVVVTHGQGWGEARTPTYQIWVSMRQRCNNPNDKAYRYYGGRGIKVCDRWELTRGGSFENFFADMGPRPDGYSIERINNDGDYEPSNCKWIPRGDQPENTRVKRDILSGQFTSDD